MIKYLELALSQEVYEYLKELDEMNWSARGNVLNQYLRNTSIGTTVKYITFYSDYKIWYIKSIPVIAYLVFDETHTNFDKY